MLGIMHDPKLIEGGDVDSSLPRRRMRRLNGVSYACTAFQFASRSVLDPFIELAFPPSTRRTSFVEVRSRGV